MSVFINPGSGPVEGGNQVDAWINVVKLCEDAGLLDRLDMPRAIECTSTRDTGDGRFAYSVRLGDRVCEIDMPGIPLVLVRFTGEGDQNIWDFPRLYVDGSSWVWKYAVGQVRDSLLGEESA